MQLNISVAMFFIPGTERELGDRLHSVNLDMTSDNHLKLLVIPCFGYLSLLYTDYPEQKCQTMEQYLKSESLILVQIRDKDNQFSKPLLA